MTLRTKVVDTVAKWCGNDDFDTATSLAVLWDLSPHAKSIPFKDQAVSLLIQDLTAAFKNPPNARDLSSFNPSGFAPGGQIDKVDELVSAVLTAPAPARKAPAKTSGGGR